MYQGSAGLDEAALAVASDAQNDVYVGGRAAVAGQGVQMFTLKLASATGTILWTDFYGQHAGLDDIAWDIVIADDGNPVTCGVSLDEGGQAAGVTRKLDAADGSQQWVSTTPGVLNNLASPDGWLVALAGGDIATCHRGYGANSYDVVLARHAADDGHARWTTVYDGPTHGGDDPRCMIRDTAGDLLVCGIQDTYWNYNYMLLKIDGEDGSVAWTAPGYDGPPGWYDAANRVAIGPGGIIIVTGLSDGEGTGWDIATVGYDPASGEQRWVTRYDGEASQSDEGRSLAVGDQGDLYITGYAYGTGTGKDHLTLHYGLPAGSPAMLPPPSVFLEPAFPNPFNPMTTIGFSLEGPQVVRLTIYGLTGTRVRTLWEGLTQPGHHASIWDGRDDHGQPLPSGVYLYALEAGSGRESGRVVLIK